MTLLLLLGGGSPSPTAGLSGDFALDGVKRPEYVYLGLEAGNHEPTEVKAPQVAKWRTASSTPNAGANTRERLLVMLSGGVFNVEFGTAWYAYDMPSDPQLSATASHYWMVEFAGKLYMGDGVDYLTYDPKKAELTKWESEGAGALPEKCKLAAVYHGRMVLARAEGDPQNWFMSAVSDPNDFDFFPPVFTVDQAIAGNLAEADKVPDVINTMIPYNDDLLIFGCDHSIWLLRGDPMSAGRLDEISKTIGIAFGNSWCRDERGVIYFFGSKGGVYRMVPGSLPEVLSDSRGGQDVSIHRRLTEIDLGSYRIDMAWDFERHGCRVVLVPVSESETTNQLEYFWDSKTNAWSEDTKGVIALQGYCIASVDGDLPDDRRVVVGCQDGFLREYDRDAVSDDGTAISSHVVVGPMTSGGDVEVILNRAKAILVASEYGCDFEVFVATDPDINFDTAVPAYTGRFNPGQNPRLPIRKRGSFVWLKLLNVHAGERWAVDELLVDLKARGIRRVRA